MRPRPDASQLATGILAGERAALSRAVTLVESQRPDDRALVRELLTSLRERAPARQPSLRIGITGSPGAGKSTFIETYGSALLADGHRLAVLAVDPSSSQTRGSILGDKTRMPTLASDPRSFVRPSPAGATLGGLTAGTRRTVDLCELAGFDRILVETVGVGQSEHAVHALTDCMVLLVLPGGGDDLQGIKRGVVELADLVVVTRADGDTAALARETARAYRQALHLQPPRADGWTPRAVTASSLHAGGLTGFGESLTAYLSTVGAAGIARRRRSQRAAAFEEAWPALLAATLRAHPTVGAMLGDYRARALTDDHDLGLAPEQFVDALTALISPQP